MHSIHKDQNSFYSQIKNTIDSGIRDIYNKFKSIGIICKDTNINYNRESCISIKFSSDISNENKRKYIMIILEVIESCNRKHPNDINNKSKLKLINPDDFINGKEIKDLDGQLDNYLVVFTFCKFDEFITIGTNNLRYQNIDSHNFIMTYAHQMYTMMAMNFLSIKYIMDTIYDEISKTIKEEN